MKSTPELTAIRDAAQQLAAKNRVLTALGAAQQAALVKAVEPITKQFRSALDEAAAERAEAEAELLRLVEAAPALFGKPRSITVDGVKTGFRKEEDSLDWSDEKAVMARIENLLPELADLLIRTETTLVKDALGQLTESHLKRIGVRKVLGADRAFVTVGECDVDKLVKIVLADAARRIGDDEPAKKAGKTKVKANASA
ncbi:MAG: hypothetical protein Q8Q80_01305 [Methyloversatilis sp.]|uniref:host-nuclease inhibitor Gam family protein n=1 Tax=Methyloversatilis sp. TaxID=2569862 RepID=UPI002734E3EA|nr:host-nuclease inhibitor Gam family protein [Methyloversatilis sp.]MDP3871274.1 hypothetical protein [Methyloversatilis sp.]